MTTHEELLTLLGPPSDTPPPVDWSRAAVAEIGLSEYPSDYRQFCATYPALIIGEFLHVGHPGPSGVRLRKQFTRNLEAIGELRDAVPGAVPFAIHPEHGGLYPWGATDNGDWLFWLTDGPPDSWPTIAISRSGSARYDGPMTEFLVQVLSGTYRFELFPADFPSAPLTVYQYT